MADPAPLSFKTRGGGGGLGGGRIQGPGPATPPWARPLVLHNGTPLSVGWLSSVHPSLEILGPLLPCPRLGGGAHLAVVFNWGHCSLVPSLWSYVWCVCLHNRVIWGPQRTVLKGDATRSYGCMVSIRDPTLSFTITHHGEQCQKQESGKYGRHTSHTHNPPLPAPVVHTNTPKPRRRRHHRVTALRRRCTYTWS